MALCCWRDLFCLSKNKECVRGMFWLLNGSIKGRDALAHVVCHGILGCYWKHLFQSAVYSCIVLGVWWILGFCYLVGFTTSLLYFWRKKKSSYFEHLVWKLSLGCAAPGVKYFLDCLNKQFLLPLAFSSCPFCCLRSNQILMQILSRAEAVAWAEGFWCRPVPQSTVAT